LSNTNSVRWNNTEAKIIAFAGFLHDIGKFVGRAKILSEAELEKLKNHHANRILPYNKEQNRHTHIHSLGTAWFILWLEEELQEVMEKLKSEEDFLNLSAKHHKPETPLEWIIAMADRTASGFDRESFEEYNKEFEVRDYRKTRLHTIFEQVFSNKEELNYRYAMKEVSPENIFPEKMDKGDEEEYKKLLKNFLEDVKKLRNRENIALWIEHFESLFMIYASHIPAATVGKVGKFIPDVSLFDHCKITSALASALYLHHRDTKSLEIEKIQNEKEKKILIVNGNFHGIQNFIFSQGGETNRNAAKLLRGRSFSISLYTELASDMLLREIGLTSLSVILNDAGKFTILAPNTEEAKKKIRKVEEKINRWLIENFYGEVSIGFAFVEASLSDFQIKENKFRNLWDKLIEKTEEKKFQKFNLNKHKGGVSDYLNSFKELGICDFCGKRPAECEFGNDGDKICPICKDQIFLGEKIVKEERIAITEKDADIYDIKLSKPIFDFYQISFATGNLTELSKTGKLLKYWDISIPEKEKISKEITAKFINGYVPKFEKNEDENELLNRILAKGKSEKTKEQLLNDVKNEEVKSFLFIAKYALNRKKDKPEKFEGVEYIGVLKADIDKLGNIFGLGIKNATFSRYATLSRQINNFFTVYIPYVLKTEEKFKNIYTVFAGGDDLFLIGPWNRIIDFAVFMNKRFMEYVCENEKITISAGITVNSPAEPVNIIALMCEEKLKNAKKSGRAAICVFGESVKWGEFFELEKNRKEIKNLYDAEIINNAMFYRLLEISQMAGYEKKLLKKMEKGEEVSIKKFQCMKWRSLLRYNCARNIAKNKKGEEREKIVDGLSQKFALWIEKYRGKMRIPLCRIIYDLRGG